MLDVKAKLLALSWVLKTLDEPVETAVKGVRRETRRQCGVSSGVGDDVESDIEALGAGGVVKGNHLVDPWQ